MAKPTKEKPKLKPIIGLILTLIMTTHVLAMESELGPEYSTQAFYRLARLAYVEFTTSYTIEKEHKLEQHTLQVLPQIDITFEDALTSVKTAYRHNNLECGLHPGIPVKLWDSQSYGGLRGIAEFGNHKLNLLIRGQYEKYQLLSKGIKLRDIGAKFDPLEHPYMDFDLAYVPRRGTEMDELARTSVRGLKETFDKEEEKDQARLLRARTAQEQASKKQDSEQNSNECQPS